MQYKNIIFDLDGTLWDSRETLLISWNRVLKEHQLISKDLIASDLNPFMGLLVPDILKTMFPDKSIEILDSIQKEIEETEPVQIKKLGGKLYSDVASTLEQLAKTRNLYIVSNCQAGYIESFLEFYDFKFFKDFECFGNTQKPKDFNIRMLMNRNQLISYETIYVGDTQTDFNAAKANDLGFIFCEYGFGKLLNCQAEAYLYKFNELLHTV